MAKPSDGIYLDQVLAHDCCMPECESPATEMIWHPLCSHHAMGVYKAVRSLVAGATPEQHDQALRVLERDRIRGAKDAVKREQEQVYYMRMGRYIKIGHTSNLKSRMRALRVDESNLLATEPGGEEMERGRHYQFAHLRVGRREDFRPADDLMRHIARTREKHGEPTITGSVGQYSPAVRAILESGG